MATLSGGVATPSGVATLASMRCAECSVGPFAVYGPTCIKAPDRILKARVALVRLRPNQTLLREGEVSSRTYTINSGWAYRFHELPKSRRQILRILIPGDPIYLSSISTPTAPVRHGIRAITNVVLCAFDSNQMNAILFDSEEQRARLASEVAAQFNELDRRLTDIGQRRAIARVASFLLDLKSRLCARGFVLNDGFELPVRQELIADALGLTQVHVNRTLAELRRLEYIRFERGRMEILDNKGLQQATFD